LVLSITRIEGSSTRPVVSTTNCTRTYPRGPIRVPPLLSPSQALGPSGSSAFSRRVRAADNPDRIFSIERSGGRLLAIALLAIRRDRARRSCARAARGRLRILCTAPHDSFMRREQCLSPGLLDVREHQEAVDAEVAQLSTRPDLPEDQCVVQQTPSIAM
jgi:hypothetical protein